MLSERLLFPSNTARSHTMVALVIISPFICSNINTMAVVCPVGSNVVVSPMDGNEAEMSIAINRNNPNNLVIAAHSPSSNTLNTFFSTDGGVTWTLRSLGQMEDGVATNSRFDPTVAIDAGGNVYVGYGVGKIAVAPTRLIVAKSINGGDSYTASNFRCDLDKNGLIQANAQGSGQDLDLVIVATPPTAANCGN